MKRQDEILAVFSGLHSFVIEVVGQAAVGLDEEGIFQPRKLLELERATP